MIKFKETKTFYYDGITDRTFEDREITTQDAEELLEEWSRERTLLYEALSKLRRYGPELSGGKRISGNWTTDDFRDFVNYAIMVIYHSDGNYEVPRGVLEKLKVEPGKEFYTDVDYWKKQKEARPFEFDD